MNLFTRNGDAGNTQTLDSGRISKNSPIIEMLGELDEASSLIGLVKTLKITEQSRLILSQIQIDLSLIMTEIAGDKKRAIDESRINWLEMQIGIVKKNSQLPEEFIFSFSKTSSAILNLSRAIIRRVERRVVALKEKGLIKNKEILVYMNRLSLFLFVLTFFEEQNR